MKNVTGHHKEAAELRQRAEDLAMTNKVLSPVNLEALSPEEILRIIHELQVHQFELEMQNEELIRVQTELDLARERYFELYELAPMGYCTISEQGLIVEANFKAATLLGVDKGALVGRQIALFILDEDQDIYYLHRKQLLQGGEPQVSELRMTRSDKMVFWARLEANITTHDSSIEPVCRIIMTDITEQKHATEDVLRESDTKHRRLFENMTQGVIYQAANDEIISANPAAQRILGLTLDQLLGKTSLDPRWKSVRHDGSDLPGEEHPSMVALRTGKPVERYIMGVIKQPENAYTWISVTAVPIFHLGETTPFQVYVTFDDITEQRQAEQNYRTLFQEMLDGFALHEIICDCEGRPVDYRFLAVNPAFEKMTGLKAADVIGRTVLEILPSTESCWIETYGRVALTGDSIHFENYSSDFQKHFEISAFRPAPNQFAYSFADITDRKKAEQERLLLTDRLRQAQKMEAIGTLAGGIAHDFNNILSAILGYAEMAREDCLSGSVRLRDLDQVIQAGDRAKDLVKQILAFSRQAEAQKIPMRPFAIVKESIKLLRSSIPTTIDIQQAIEPQTDLILADSIQIHQIIMNLCTNAYHAMEETGGTLSVSLKNGFLSQQDLVTVSHVKPGKFVQLSIRDTGPGVTAGIQKRMFDPYFTTKDTGKGTGLGLAIVHGIVNSYGGFISCQSEIGVGTVFEISLPAITETVIPEKVEIKLTSVGTERILLIDDESMLVEMSQAMLERLGYDVTVRMNSIEALTTFKNQPDAFDLVITDQTMPGMTGIDLARRMLQIRPNLPIILCTGYSNMISEEKIKSIGIKGFALKPMAKKEIANLIRQILDEGKVIIKD